MKMPYQKKQNQKAGGFTLIEIMVAVSIFALVMVVAIGAVLSIVSANKKSQAVTSVLTNLNFSLEAMVRDLRTGYDYSCDNGGDCTDGGDIVSFNSTQSDNKVVEYTLDNNTHAIAKSVDGQKMYLTSQDVNIKDLKFYVTGTTKTASGDYDQPRILIIVDGNYNGFGDLANFHLQTMVSQRRIDI